MKKSVLFLINGLGIEKQGSYSISIDQCMPNLAKTKETSFFTTAVIDSVEYHTAYEKFFLGDTYKKEMNYIKENIINDNIVNNPTYQSIKNFLSSKDKKLHVFLEATNDFIVEEVNDLVNKLNLDKDQKVYLHLLLTQQSVTEYKKLIELVNYIKYHLDTRITVGFIFGKETLSNELNKEEVDIFKKMFFYCSCERWTETDKKLLSLKESNIRPCVAPGFCAVNGCNIVNGDVILFFNTKKSNYDKYIQIIYNNASEVFKTEQFNIPLYSIINLDTKYNVLSFSNNIVYDNSLDKLLEKTDLKVLFITKNENINYVNFLANGLNYVSNPRIQFMNLDDNYLSNNNNIINIIDNTDYNLIVFDYHMDVSKTVNDLKEQLEKIDVVLGNVANTCVNKHSLFITSLYGLKKDLPLAPYNSEIVTIDYEMQIPIFFFDYSFPRSKYRLVPGETNDILSTAIRCVCDNKELTTLVRTKGLLTSLLFK
ncbi:MAG: hypothetical protein IJ097_04195 [Bacilli bacterium]|nr:hypothetical protein [Bacilli bacterium]